MLLIVRGICRQPIATAKEYVVKFQDTLMSGTKSKKKQKQKLKTPQICTMPSSQLLIKTQTHRTGRKK